MGLLNRLIVRSDIANWRMPSPWSISGGIGSPFVALAIARIAGDLVLAKLLLMVVPTMVTWLAVVMIRRLWCDRHPYLPPRWLAAARTTHGDGLIDAALARLRDTPPRDPERVLRRGEMIEAIIAERDARADARKAATGVRLADAASGREPSDQAGATP